jgi:hypothetical protein
MFVQRVQRRQKLMALRPRRMPAVRGVLIINPVGSCPARQRRPEERIDCVALRRGRLGV